MDTPATDTEAQNPLLLDSSAALQLVSGFFDKEWPRTDEKDVHTKHITGGFMNTLQLIWRDNAAITEPAAVLIRHFGQSGKIEEPPSSHLTLSAAQQAIVYWEMSRRGWGPRVYGFFAGGRLEEYIDSHTLTAAECTQDAIRRDVARSYARLHSLRLPLRKDNFHLIVREMCRDVQRKHDEIGQALLAANTATAQEYLTVFQEFDWVQEMEWVAELFKKHNCKTTITQGDTNHLNVLVKNFESDCRIVLIDYETVTYSYRGFDLGGHFTERMYCHSQPGNRLTGHAAPDSEEQRSFCEAYLQEMRDLGEELTGFDTVEHLVLEASIGRLFQILFTNLICFLFEGFAEDVHLLDSLVHTMQVYGQLKREFVQSHGKQY
ncbi:hypothetical protein Q7P37_006950 [Cladosporium fusiforme]